MTLKPNSRYRVIPARGYWFFDGDGYTVIDTFTKSGQDYGKRYDELLERQAAYRNWLQRKEGAQEVFGPIDVVVDIRDNYPIVEEGTAELLALLLNQRDESSSL